jgi:hypothetical protein
MFGSVSAAIPIASRRRASLAAAMLGVVLALGGCTSYQPPADPSLAFGPGDNRAVVIVGISPGQRDGRITFTRLEDGRNRMVETGVGAGPAGFSVSNRDVATAIVVTPGRYVVSKASIVTHRGWAYRPGYTVYGGVHSGWYGRHHRHHPRGWGWGYDPYYHSVSITEGERFEVRNGPRGIANQSWIVVVPPGRVTALGHFAFDWRKANNVLNVAHTPFDRETIAATLSAYPRVTAPVVEPEWLLYGPDLPLPPIVHWSQEF